MKKVLFLSAGTPCRAVMAKAILTKDLKEKSEIFFDGAGIENNKEINDNAIKILVEEGIDISSLMPKILSDVAESDYDLVVTICEHSKEICPVFPKAIPTIHLEFPIIDQEDEKTCREFVARLRRLAAPIILRELS
jgi:arsenate reductase